MSISTIQSEKDQDETLDVIQGFAKQKMQNIVEEIGEIVATPYASAGTQSGRELTLRDRLRLITETIPESYKLNILGFIRIEMPKGKWAKVLHKLGGPESVATLIQTVELDENFDGIVSPEELLKNEEHAKSLISSSLTLLNNCGIIGSLILTMLYPLVVAGITPCDESVTFFGTDGIYVIKLLFEIFVVLAIVEALALIYASVRFYTMLSFWLPNVKSKIWYVQEISLAPAVKSSCRIIQYAAFIIPLGAALNSSPKSGVIGIIGGMIFLIRMSSVESIGPSVLLRQHQEAREILRKFDRRHSTKSNANSTFSFQSYQSTSAR